MVKLSSGFLSSRQPIAEGGEATIYKYNKGVIKIFKQRAVLISKKKKVEKLLNMNLPDGVVGPKDLVFDNNDDFIGYLMPEVHGEEIRKLCSKKYLKLNNITTKNIVDMLLKFSKILDELHKSNLVIGDLNECNILFDSNCNIYVIDVDSWKMGNLKCTVAMESFQDPNMTSSNFSKDTDYYSFAVLVFKILTMLHPFGGSMDPDMNILERMKNKISVLNSTKVTIPTRLCKGWKFFSPQLQDDLKKIFTTNDRFSLTDTLQDFSDHLKFCIKHNDFYYSKYSKCPVCNNDAVIVPDIVKSKPVSAPVSVPVAPPAKPKIAKKKSPVVAPVKVAATSGEIPITIVFKDNDVKAMLNEYAYVGIDNVVKFRDQDIFYSYSPNVEYYVYDGNKTIISTKKEFALNDGKQVYKFEKLFGSQIIVKDKYIYYINPVNKLVKLQNDINGNISTVMQSVSFENYFNIYDDNHYIIINKYDGHSIICVDGYNFEMDISYKINDYGLHYDPISKTWLVILKDFSNQCHIMIFKQNTLIYQNDKLHFSCVLDYITYYKSIIYIPKDGYIRGYNYTTNNYKDFQCKDVADDCKLIKNGPKFTVIAEDGILEIG